MKSKEEIEQLAEKYADGYSTEEAHASYIAFQDGYTKCQEDVDWELLVKLSKRYTEEDMANLWQYVVDGAKSILIGNVVTIGGFEDYIKSLNKLD